MTRALAALAALGVPLGAGCAPAPATQIVVVIDTDLGVPDELDAVVIRVEGPSSDTTERTVALDGAGATPLPLTFAMVPAGSELGPVTVTVIGQVLESDVVERVVRTRFLEEQGRILRIRLYRSCIAMVCDPMTTCDDGVCVPMVVAPESLPTFTGMVRVPELCNSEDDDADGRTDEDFDVQSDAQNCGMCGNVCIAGRPCQGGSCIDSPLVALAAGGSHTCAIRESGGVTCWGSNTSGELGDGTLVASSLPVSTRGIADARDISAGTLYTCAARADGTSACWGSGLGGELGTGVYEDRQVPSRTVGIENAVQTTAGYYHSCALFSSGGAKCWGHDSYGELGNGVVVAMVEAPVEVMSLTDATEIRVGYQHTCALRAGGEVSCWGDNSVGQVGDGSMALRNLPTPVMGISGASGIAPGDGFSCAMLSSGSVMCWGRNDAGQLGVDPAAGPSSAVPVMVAALPEAPRQISSGHLARFVCAVGASGAVYCWGKNEYGQLGDGTMVSRHVPMPVAGLADVRSVSVGTNHACALLETSREVWCWGEGTYGQLGDGRSGNSAVPVRVSSL